MPKPKKSTSTSDVRLYSVTHLGGLREVFSVPSTARITIYAGKAPDPSLKRYTSELSPAGQLRIYQGNRLIAFFPAIQDIYEIGAVAHHPIGLPKGDPADALTIGVDFDTARFSLSSAGTGTATR